MKKLICTILVFSIIISLGAAVFAEGFEWYNDYMNKDKTYSYYFNDLDLTITMPENWYKQTFADGASEEHVRFIHKASYEEAQKDTVYSGVLFSLYCKKDPDLEKLPSYEVLGYTDDGMCIYAMFPTDYQGTLKTRDEYDNLCAEAEDIVKSITFPGRIECEDTDEPAPSKASSKDPFAGYTKLK